MEHSGDPAFQARDWRAQRAGRVLLALFVAAAAAGWIGPGPCNDVRLEADDRSFSIDFERVLHQHAPSALRISLHAPSRRIGVILDEDARVDLERIRPKPARERGAPGELLLEYDSDQRGALELEIVPRTLGVVRTQIRIGDASPRSLSQLVLP